METGEMAQERVCIVTPAFSIAGGMRTIIRQLIKVLSEKYEVTLLSIKFKGREEQRLLHYDIALNPKLKNLFTPWHIPTLLLYELSGGMWCFALRMLGIKKFLVQDASVSAFFTTLIGKMTGAHIYVFDYGLMLNLYNPNFIEMLNGKYRRGFLTIAYANLLKIMSRVSVRHSDKFFIHHQEMKKLALNHGLNDDKIVLYTYPVDTNIFRPYDRNEMEKMREKHGFKKEENIVTYVGRLTEDKGLPYLIESAKILVKKYPRRVKFIIVGDGPLEDWLLESTKGSLQSYVLCLGPFHDSKNIADILNASDIFVYPITISGGYAMAFLEAMATGVPGVITDVGPTKELIVAGYNGVVVPAKNAEALGNALERLIENEELRKSMGENARKVLAKFSRETYRRSILSNVT